MKHILIFMLLVSSACLQSSCSNAKVKAVKLTLADSNKTVTAAMDQEIILRLPANSSTGYYWAFQGEHEGLQLLSDNYEVDPRFRDRDGAGGIHTFRFKAVKAGSSEINLLYSRGEENGWGQRYKVTVSVK